MFIHLLPLPLPLGIVCVSRCFEVNVHSSRPFITNSIIYSLELSFLHSWSVEILATPEFGWQVPGMWTYEDSYQRAISHVPHVLHGQCLLSPVGDYLLDLLQTMKNTHQAITIAIPNIVSAIWFKQDVVRVLRHKHRHAICEATSLGQAFLTTVFSLPIIIKLCWLTRESKRVSRGPLFSLATILTEGERYTYPGWFRAVHRLCPPNWTPWWRVGFFKKYSLRH